MDELHFNGRRARERAQDDGMLESHFCSVAAAVVGGMVVGGALSGGGDTPDTSGMNQAAQDQAALSKEQLEWSKQIYADTAPERAEATRIALEQGHLQTEAAKKQLAAADDTLAYQNSTFRPVEQKLASDALGYDTPARREAAAAAAAADVTAAAAGQRQATMTAMERRGALPSSGRVMAMQGMQDIETAKARAGAANTARQQVETMGTAKMADVANLGRNIASNQVAQVQSGIQAGNSASANGQVPVNVAASGAGIMQQGFAGASQSMASSGALYGQIANINNQANANNNSQMQGFGSGVGQLAAMYFASDENEKEGIEPVDPDKALEEVRETPVSNWAYKADGIYADGGQPHTGAMAQDVHRTMGEKAAPAGKMIDPITVTGVTMAAVQALDKKVSMIAAAVGMNETKKHSAARHRPAAAAGMAA